MVVFRTLAFVCLALLTACASPADGDAAADAGTGMVLELGMRDSP